MSFPVPLPSTFMPLPLAIMIPFMGIQSGVMAQQFGMNFQFGKRKISSMSNEEFNKLTPEQMQADFSNQIKGLIPTFGESLKDMRPFQRMIFEEMLAVFKTAVDLGIDVGIAGAEGIAHGLGTHAVKHGEEELPTIDEHKFLSPLEKRIHERHGHTLPTETISTPVQTFTPQRTDLNIDAPDTHRHTIEHHKPAQAAIPLFRQRPIGIPSKIYTFRKRLTKLQMQQMIDGHRASLRIIEAGIRNPKTPSSNKRNMINFLPWVKMNLTEALKAQLVYNRTNAYA